MISARPAARRPRPGPPLAAAALTLLTALAATPAFGQEDIQEDISVQNGDDARLEGEDSRFVADIEVATSGPTLGPAELINAEAEAGDTFSTLTVDAATVTLDPDDGGGRIRVGQSGNRGSITIQNGGSIVSSSANGGQDDRVVLGDGGGSFGGLTVTGDGSQFVSAGTVDVGSLKGFGELLLEDGGTATLATLNAGVASIGEITVNGPVDGSASAAGTTRLRADTIRLGGVADPDGAISSGGLGVFGGGVVDVGVLDVGVPAISFRRASSGRIDVGGEDSRIDVEALRIGGTGGSGFTDGAGFVDVRDGGLIVLTGSTNAAFDSSIGRRGTLSLRDGGVFRNDSQLNVSNTGSLELQDGGVFRNNGRLNVSDAGRIGLNAGGVLENNGTVDTAPGAAPGGVAIPGAINFDGGTLAGVDGTFNGPLTVGAGGSVTIAPGAAGADSVSTLNFNGPIQVVGGGISNEAATVTLAAQALGAAADRVILMGGLTFGPLAEVLVQFENIGSAFNGAVDTSWVVAELLGGITGTPNFSLMTDRASFGDPDGVFSLGFSEIAGGGTAVNVNYAANVAGVPEPASMALFSLIAAGGGAGAWRRKRRAKAAA